MIPVNVFGKVYSSEQFKSIGIEGGNFVEKPGQGQSSFRAITPFGKMAVNLVSKLTEGSAGPMTVAKELDAIARNELSKSDPSRIKELKNLMENIENFDRFAEEDNGKLYTNLFKIPLHDDILGQLKNKVNELEKKLTEGAAAAATPETPERALPGKLAGDRASMKIPMGMPGMPPPRTRRDTSPQTPTESPVEIVSTPVAGQASAAKEESPVEEKKPDDQFIERMKGRPKFAGRRPPTPRTPGARAEGGNQGERADKVT